MIQFDTPARRLLTDLQNKEHARGEQAGLHQFLPAANKVHCRTKGHSISENQPSKDDIEFDV